MIGRGDLGTPASHDGLFGTQVTLFASQFYGVDLPWNGQAAQDLDLAERELVIADLSHWFAANNFIGICLGFVALVEMTPFNVSDNLIH
ncbi:MAG: hypothetical protein CMM47_06955 [Rhodospirillaceae bacterium]|nr:hypothetical protein [Rhodospirillaceae bacterium]|tara:strand:+ start:117 stop:383 length:267 start_codon:yes stop_codon:yes gene_type:complete